MGSKFTFTMRVMTIYDTSSVPLGETTSQDESQIQDGIYVSDSIDALRTEDFEPIKHPIINFQGATFDTTVSPSTPVEIRGGNSMPRFDNLIAFLKIME